MEFAVGMHQNQGKREYQQDMMSIRTFPSIGVLAILADGMGGYEGGEIASRLVSESLREFVIESDDIGMTLKKYLLKGNDAIKAYKEEHPEVKSMGTTAIAFFMTDKSCQWVSVGDSPLYVIRDRSSIARINENHSVAGLLDLQVKKGEISQEEALASGQRHMLTSAISGDDIPQIDVSASLATKENDIYILASDGIETLDEGRIKEIVLKHVSVITQQNIQNACEALVNEVLKVDRQNQDNVTVIILAKKHNKEEPRTAIYRGGPLDELKNKKISIKIINGALAVIALLFAAWIFFFGDKKEDVPIAEVNQSTNIEQKETQDPQQPNVEKQKNKELQKENISKEAQEKAGKNEHEVSAPTQHTQVKKTKPKVREKKEKKVKKGTETINLPEENIKRQQKLSPKEIKKKNEELEKSGII